MTDTGLADYFDPGLGYDSDLSAQLQWYLAQGINPLMPQATPGYDIIGGGIPGPEADEEYSIEDFNRQMTGAKSINSMMMDPSFLMYVAPAFGGGFRPEDVEPIVTYEPVDQPGRRALMKWAQGEQGSFEQYVASELLAGKTPSQISNAMWLAYDDPENDAHPFISQIMPMTRQKNTLAVGGGIGDVDATTPMPDIDKIESFATGLYNDLLKDPEVTTLDEQGNPTADPKTGLPANRLEEKSEVAKAFDRAGLPYPWEPYKRDQFISPERQAEEAQYASKWAQTAAERPDQIRNKLRQVTENEIGLAADQQALARYQLGMDTFTRQQGDIQRRIAEAERQVDLGVAARPSVRGDLNFDRERANQDYRSYLDSLGAQEEWRAITLAKDLGAPPQLAPGRRRTAEGLRADLAALQPPKAPAVTEEDIRKRKYDTNTLRLQATGLRSNQLQERAYTAALNRTQQMREAQMRQLMEAGYSPYYDTVRARNQAMQAWIGQMGG